LPGLRQFCGSLVIPGRCLDGNPVDTAESIVVMDLHQQCSLFFCNAVASYMERESRQQIGQIYRAVWSKLSHNQLAW